MNFFWNETERRPRAFWRIVLFFILFIVFAIALSCVGTTAFFASRIASGQMSDLSPTAAQEMFQESPGLLAFGGISSLIGATLALILMGAFVDKRHFDDYGLRFDGEWWLDLSFGLFLGAFLMAAIFLIERAAGWLTVTGARSYPNDAASFGRALLGSVILYLSVGIYEEMMARGYLIPNLAEGFQKRIGARNALLVAWILSSIGFGLAHVLNPNTTVVSTLNLMLSGIFLGLGYVLTGDLALPIGLHITWNFFQTNVFGFAVSGMASTTSFIVIEQQGPRLWTGGKFGPEAGLMGIGAMIMGSALTLLWVSWRRGKIHLKHDLARYEPRTLEEPGESREEVESEG